MSKEFDAIINRIRKDAAIRVSEQPSAPGVTIRREPSTNEKEAIYQPPGYGQLFCCHKRSLFEPCTPCQRDRSGARLQFERFSKRYSFSTE